MFRELFENPVKAYVFMAVGFVSGATFILIGLLTGDKAIQAVGVSFPFVVGFAVCVIEYIKLNKR